VKNLFQSLPFKRNLQRYTTEAELEDLKARRAEQQKKDGYVERWLKKRGGQAAARPGKSKASVPAAAPVAQAAASSRQVRKEIGRLAVGPPPCTS
jgi:hypothetical protein